MKAVNDNSEEVSVDVRKLVDSSKMWVLVNLDENGLHFHASTTEEGMVLISIALSSNEDMWKIVKDHTEKLILGRQNKQN